MICTKCHKEIPDDSIYCCYCGYKIRRDKKKTRAANGTGYVYKRGKSWYVRVTTDWKTAEDGSKVPVYKYKGGFNSKIEALRYSQVLLDPPEEKKPMITYKELYEKWNKHYLETRPNLSKSYIRGLGAGFKHAESIYDIHIDKITPSMIQKIINDSSNLKRRTKQQILSVLKMSFDFAVDEDYLVKSPVRNIYLGENDEEHYTPLTEEELEIISQHFDDEAPYAEYVYAMAYLGFRPTAFFKLKKSDYHNEDGIEWLVGGIKTDAGIDREVTIPPKIISIIHKRLAVEGTEYIFPKYNYKRSKGNKVFTGFDQMYEHYFRENVFNPLMEKFGITGRVPYSARHTYSNKIKNVEGADRDKADLMGHTNYDFTKAVYQTSTLKERKKITDQIT